jgi:hypothetical protein
MYPDCGAHLPDEHFKTFYIYLLGKSSPSNTRKEQKPSPKAKETRWQNWPRRETGFSDGSFRDSGSNLTQQSLSPSDLGPVSIHSNLDQYG